MNKRFRELREQAMEWVPNQVDPDTKIRLLNAEKFAELIVAECLMKAIGAKIRGETIDTLIQNIKEDFGVEE